VRLAALTLLGWLLAHPAAAQVTARDPFPAVSIRPFALITEQAFAAVDTFNATFGHSYGPFFGGGGQVLIHDRIVIEIGASRFQKDGLPQQRGQLSAGDPADDNDYPARNHRRLSLPSGSARPPVCRGRLRFVVIQGNLRLR
jgi:hypothetical protein